MVFVRWRYVPTRVKRVHANAREEGGSERVDDMDDEQGNEGNI